MSASQYQQCMWTWSPLYQQYFFYDYSKQQYVWQSGVRTDVPRGLVTSPEFLDKEELPAISVMSGPQQQFHQPAHGNPNPYQHPDAYTTAHARRSSAGSSHSGYSVESLAEQIGAAQLAYPVQQPQKDGCVEHIRKAYDPKTNVRTLSQTGPKEAITDPTLFQEGGVARRMLQPTAEDQETLDSRFQVRLKPSNFFVIGRVFMTLWAEPAGETNATSISGPSLVSSTWVGSGRFGERVHQKVRRFVVVREASQFCTALPVGTYGGKGVSKDRVRKSDHAIIYSGRSPPKAQDDEQPVRREQGMRPIAIRVVPDERVDKLDPMSRIDFGKPHTIHHNLKVRPFGMVDDKSIPHLVNQFKAVVEEGFTSKRHIGAAPKLSMVPKTFQNPSAKDLSQK